MKPINLKIKKIIAKELLIFLSICVLTGIFNIGTYAFNYLRLYQIRNFEKQIKLNKVISDSLCRVVPAGSLNIEIEGTGTYSKSKLQKFLLSKEYDVPKDTDNFNSWTSNPQNANAIYNEMVAKEYYTAGDYNSFAKAYGLPILKNYTNTDYSFSDFYKDLRSNPHIVGLPDNYNDFAAIFRNPQIGSSFYKDLLASKFVKGLPTNYNDFANNFGLPDLKYNIRKINKVAANHKDTINNLQGKVLLDTNIIYTKKIRDFTSQITDNKKDRPYNTLIIFFSMILIAYPLRFVIKGIFWAIRILKTQ